MFERRFVFVVAIAVLAIHVACGERYGLFRDELYFVACGRRLAFGYVDQPPLVAVVARFAWWLSDEGRSVLVFRAPVFVSHALTAVVAGELARALGGRGFASALAAITVAVAPVQLAQGHLVTMNTFELLSWALVALLFVRAMQGAPRAWAWAGVAMGLALVTKYSAAFFAVALVAGLAISGRFDVLRARGLWTAVAIATAFALPSALWQLTHGLPFLELLANGRDHKNAVLAPLTVAKGALLEAGPAAALVALAGLAALLGRWLPAPTSLAPSSLAASPLAASSLGSSSRVASDTASAGRALGVALALVLGGLVASGAKPYYLAPAVTPLLAAGAVLVEAKLRHGLARGAVAATITLTALPAAPLVIPLLPIEPMLAWQATLGVKPERLEKLAYTDVPQHFADQFGWPERVGAVARVVEALTPSERARAVIFTTNYGRAAALELLGPPLGHSLPPVVSGHNQYFLWGVPGDPDVVIALGGARDDYDADFSSVERVATTPKIEHGMPYESEVVIWLLRGPKRPVRELFTTSKHFQ